jgi:ribosomal protein L29
VVVDRKSKRKFYIMTMDHHVRLKCENEVEREEWVKAIENAILNTNMTIRQATVQLLNNMEIKNLRKSIAQSN